MSLSVHGFVYELYQQGSLQQIVFKKNTCAVCTLTESFHNLPAIHTVSLLKHAKL